MNSRYSNLLFLITKTIIKVELRFSIFKNCTVLIFNVLHYIILIRKYRFVSSFLQTVPYIIILFWSIFYFYIPIIIIPGNTFPERCLPPVKTAPTEVRCLRATLLRPTAARRKWDSWRSLFSGGISLYRRWQDGPATECLFKTRPLKSQSSFTYTLRIDWLFYWFFRHLAVSIFWEV